VRVVFDTNIFISVFAIKQGWAHKALLKVIEGQDCLVISKPIVDELLAVLARKFSRDREELSRIAVFLTEISELVYPRRKVKVLQDEPDNRILECAHAGRADAIVTGDKAMLKLGIFKDIRIISLKAYLELS
jgi:putative PIN family toxin of toxin-antitoxin system